MNDTNKVDELIEEMHEYNEMLDNNVSTDSEKTKVLEGPLNEEKINNLPNSKDNSNSNKDNSNNSNNINNNDNKKKSILLICIYVTAITLFLIFFFSLLYAQSRTQDKKLDKDVIDKDKYISIVSRYGDAIASAVNSYMEENNNIVPEFSDIEEEIYYPNYNITCSKTTINYDGSIYLSDCGIQGYSNRFVYTYGQLKEKPKESKNNIYIYQNIDENNSANFYYASNTKMEFETEYPKLIETYDCSDVDCRGYQANVSNNKDVVIYDSKYYLYNPITKEKKELKGIGKYNYQIIDNIVDNNLNTYALFVKKDDGMGAYYLVNKQKLITDFEYVGDTSTKTMISHGYFAGKNQLKNSYKICLINQNTGEVVKNFKDAVSIKEIELGGKPLFYVSSSTVGEQNGYFLDSSYNKLIKDKNKYNFAINSDNTITIKNTTTYSIYDNNGTKIYDSKKYASVEKVLKDYSIVTDGNDVLIIDQYETKSYKLFDLQKDYSFHPQLSGWYEKENKYGIYFVVEDRSVEEGKEGRGLEYYFIPETEEIGVIKTTGIGGYAKPDLY